MTERARASPAEAGTRPEEPPAPGAGAAAEVVVWSGTPSQWTNLPGFLVSAVGVGAVAAAAIVLAMPLVLLGVVPFVAIAFWKWLQVRCTRIELTSERIKTRTGVLSRVRHELELYRVKDTTLEEPLLLRIVSLGNIQVLSSDKSSPVYWLRAIQHAESVREQIRAIVERLRTTKRVSEVDYE